MFNLFKKRAQNFDLDVFKNFRRENPDTDYMLGVIAVEPVLQIADFAASELWEKDRKIKDYQEALNLALHVTPSENAAQNITQIDQRIKSGPQAPEFLYAGLFSREIWKESADFPSFGNGGSHSFKELESAKTDYFLLLQEEFVSLAEALERLRGQSDAH